MKYEIKPCVEEDEDFIEEKLDAFCYSIVPPEEGAKDEDIVFKITDGEGIVIRRTEINEFLFEKIKA